MSTYSRRRKKSKPQTSPAAPEPPSAHQHNRLLAGYLAEEFLTSSTLFGQKWDPARAEAAPLETSNRKRLRAEPVVVKRKCYEEVTFLLKSGEAQLAGVFNPSQLVGWLQL